jgi:hypothetical protein
MPKGTYKVPIRINASTTGEESLPHETRPSNLLVFVAPGRTSQTDIEITEMWQMKGLYEATLPSSFSDKRHVWFQHRKVPLSRVPVGATVLIEIAPKETRALCAEYNGKVHAVTGRSGYRRDTVQTWSLTFLCGDYASERQESLHFTFRENVAPSCPECQEARWVPFVVCPYEVPRQVRLKTKKVVSREAKKVKRYLALPTRFDRALEERSPRFRAPPPVVEVEDPEPMGREDKLQSRQRQAQVEKSRQKR